MSFVLKQQNKTRFIKKIIFSALLFVCFYPTVTNFNRNKHIKPIVNRSTFIGWHIKYIDFV